MTVATRDRAERQETAAVPTGKRIDPTVRGGAEAMVLRLNVGAGMPAKLIPAVHLAAREIDVLRQVAFGISNRHVHAVRMAPEVGVID